MPLDEQETRRGSKTAVRRTEAAVQPVRPLSPASMEAIFNPSQDDMDKKRDHFEDKGKDAARQRLRKLVGMHASQTEVQRFLGMMGERGGGNIAVAWRRYFDSDGDGELSFKEFCGALIDLSYEGNVLTLWHDLRREGDAASRVEADSESLRLEDLDKESAAVLEYFGRWCEVAHGGPSEVFKKMDEDGSDSLTRDEFAEGLTALGFFKMPGVPKSICSEDLVTANLFPLLDQTGTGACACEQLMFLEKDPVKKAKVLRQLARMREHGHEGAPEPLRNNAQRLLHQLAMQTTPLGGKPWQLVTAKVAVGEEWANVHSGSPKHASRRSSGLVTAGASVLSKSSPQGVAIAARGGATLAGGQDTTLTPSRVGLLAPGSGRSGLAVRPRSA